MADLKVLVVDDEPRMRKLVKDFLVKKDYKVIEAGDGEEAIDLFFKDKDISLVILDVMMPKMNGWQVCREIRKYSRVPIIMLTAKSSEEDELTGFECGADEYVSKPFSPKILVARVDALLRRSGKGDESGIIKAGCIEVNKVAHIVKVNGKEVELSFKEFELLCALYDNAGRVLSRDQLLTHVWGYDYYGDERTVDSHIARLRTKLGRYGAAHLKTVYGMGYKLEL